MERIQHYPLEVTPRQVVSMPAGAQPLNVAVLDGCPQLAVLADPEALQAERAVLMASKSQSVDSGAQYVGSFVGGDGRQAHHVFVALA